MDFEIKLLQSGNIEDFSQLLTVFDEVFEYKPYSRPDNIHLISLLKKNSFYVIVAKMRTTIIGGVTAYTLDQYHSTQPILYIQDLAVLAEYQRKGVGKNLLEFMINLCKENNFQQMLCRLKMWMNMQWNFIVQQFLQANYKLFIFFMKLTGWKSKNSKV